MDAKVKVTADDKGLVIIPSENNPLYGYIRVAQTRMQIDDATGFAKRVNLSALIPGKVEDLKGFGWVAGQEVEGKIRVVEQLEAFSDKNPEKDYKVAGSSEIVCTVDDQAIYRKHFYCMNASKEDVYLEHNNQDVIKAHYANAPKTAMKPSEDFTL